MSLIFCFLALILFACMSRGFDSASLVDLAWTHVRTDLF